MTDYARELQRILTDAGWKFLRQAAGDQPVWEESILFACERASSRFAEGEYTSYFEHFQA